MIDHELLIKCVTEAAAEVFSTMLDMRIEYTGIVSEFRQSESGLISLVGITGEWGGSGIFCCSPAFANLLHGRMLGEDSDPDHGIDGEVLDVVAEVTNMMVGNIKNSLEATTGPLAISVPTVIHGRNFQFRNSSGFRGVALSFLSEGEQFELRIALAPSANSVGVRSRVPVLGLAHI